MSRRRRASRIVGPVDGLSPAFRRSETETGESAEQRIAREQFERGRTQGREEAATEFENRARELNRQVGESLRRLGEIEQRIAAEWRTVWTELALETASRIVREKIEAGDPVATRAVREALDVLPTGGTIRARVHPDDLESIRQDLDAAISRARLELVGDPGISRGGCVVESEGGSVDATIETAGEAMREAATGKAAS